MQEGMELEIPLHRSECPYDLLLLVILRRAEWCGKLLVW